MIKGARKNHFLKLAIFTIVGLSVVAFFVSSVAAQRGKRVRRPANAPRAAAPYNNFLHNSPAHRRQSCSECHKSPTGLSGSMTETGESYRYPDITDYPDHDACVSCHRQQFFRGARPAICAVCHTRVSPRDKARLAFPQPTQTSEFDIYFPHNIHQDIIARRTSPSTPRDRRIAPAHLVAAKFTPGEESPDALPAQTTTGADDYNNCAICHYPASGRIYTTKPRRPQLVALETGKVAASHSEKITAPAGYFETLPNGHDSCFNCHYSEQRPTRNECGACHISPQGRQLPETSVIERISLKFNHNEVNEKGDRVHGQDCTSCHIGITQSNDLRTLFRDVPITTCAGACHSDEIKMEVTQREKDLVEKQKNPQFEIKSCSYCHNLFIGSHQVPEHHKAIK